MQSPFKRRVARLRHHAALDAPKNHPRLASVSVGPLGEATALWTDSAGLAAIGADGEVLAPPRPGRSRAPASATVTFQGAGRHEEIGIAELTTPFPVVQPLPNGQALVVGARAAWLPDGPEHNATIYGPDGSPLLTACVGDGIEQVRTTPTGAVWLGYFDEGVYGNLGWGEPPGPEPIGWPGLLKMTSQLAIEWRYPADELEPIDDCYALNLAGEVAWACPYSTFCVTRVEDAQVRLWPNQMEGAHAIVVDGDRVALVGGYGGGRDRLVVGRLDESFTAESKSRLAMPNGTQVPAEAVMVGQADKLHVFVGREWFRMNIDEMTSQSL